MTNDFDTDTTTGLYRAYYTKMNRRLAFHALMVLCTFGVWLGVWMGWLIGRSIFPHNRNERKVKVAKGEIEPRPIHVWLKDGITRIGGLVLISGGVMLVATLLGGIIGALLGSVTLGIIVGALVGAGVAWYYSKKWEDRVTEDFDEETEDAREETDTM